MLILSASDVSRVASTLPLSDVLNLMARVFVRLHTRTGVVSPHRLAIDSPRYNALFMPSRLDESRTAIKIVAVPKDSRVGLSASTLLLNEETGAAEALVNATGLTALRTAAGSVLATRLIGPAVPHVLLAFGAGRQIEAHVDLLLRTFPSLNRCVIVNRAKNARLETLRSSLQSRFPHVQFISQCAIEGVGRDTFDLRHAVVSADIICTATSSTKPLFNTEWVKVGTHINLIGSYTPHMAEVDGALIKRARKVLVDSRDACSLEAGELLSARLSPDDMIEVGQLMNEDGTEVAHEIMAMRSAGDVTIFKSVGVGLQDVAIASAVVEQAITLGIGTWIHDELR